MKKNILVFMAILLFVNIWLPSTSEAAIASKVVGQAAKKVAKEVATDVAIDMTFNMVMDYKYVPKDERKAKPGYEMICLPKNRTSDGDCSAPVQIKKNITRAEIAPQIEKQLEKKIAGGVTSTKWGKFLDWFVPIFATGMAFSVIDYAINGDVSDLFDEIAWDALAENGLLEIVTENSTTVPTGVEVVFQGGNSTSKTLRFRSLTDNNSFELFYDGFGQSIPSTHYIDIYLTKYADYTYLAITGTYARDVVYDAGKIDEINSKESMLALIHSAGVTIRKVGSIPPTLPKHGTTGLPRTRSAGTNTPVVAPGAFPMQQTSTGQQVYPYTKKDGTIGFRDIGGIEITEDDVTVLNPQIQENPDGSRTVVKAPSMTETGELETHDPKKDGILPPVGGGTDNPNNGDLPEGQTCDDTLKLPRFAPLMRSMSESFPFSIPWDLKSGFDALFSEMGQEKPKFSYKFKFQNELKEWKIEIPTFFDDWMPFVHSVLLFIFDVGILYGIFRLIKGGG